MEGAVLPDDVCHILVSVAAMVEEDRPDLLFGETRGQDVVERIVVGKEYVTHCVQKQLIWPSSTRGMGLHTRIISFTLLYSLCVKGLT